ncbi:FtsK/SpoIIIE domain-containing protein [Mycolicibacterium llatzerense]|uniref:FtsK/SpoIIIE domain-containing protein n=1 Tax=Mycolicibacterium llatzerense TaxID=280871 RepID=UPI0008DD83EF|nr:FtsK/SpoIIIE domain-containing protein [Mycolicibacterium llatzerense]
MTTSTGNEDLDRVLKVLMSSNLPLELVPDSPVLDETGSLLEYKLKATKAGYFGDKRLSTIVITKLEHAVTGDWEVDVDAASDLVIGARKAPFPDAIAPDEPTFIAQSAEEAIENYSNFKLKIGVDKFGEVVEIGPLQAAHILGIGGTGAGKSVSVRGFIEQYRAGGWPLYIMDGKKSDYASLGSVAQIIMISSDTAEHVRIMHAVREEVDRRYRIAQQRKLAGDPNPFAFEPLLFILDEYASVLSEVQSLYGKAEGGPDDFEADFRHIGRKGREAKVHMLLLTQDLYDKTIPGDIRGNFKAILALGKPERMTLGKAFPNELQEKAQRIGDRISARGRSMVADVEAAKVIEYQGYFGYTPGMNIDHPDFPDKLRPAWRSYRDNISNKIPALYGRQWFKVESAEDLELPIAQLNALPMVNLDNRDGTPNPDMYQYDKSHISYNGQSFGSGTGGALMTLDHPGSTSRTRDGASLPGAERVCIPDNPEA